MRNQQHKYHFKSWREYFICEVPEFYMIPKFFLPVWRDPARLTVSCSFFAFAPFLILGRILIGVLWKIWLDLVEIATTFWNITKF